MNQVFNRLHLSV